MQKLASLWVNEINRKKSLQCMLKDLHFSISFLTENESVRIKAENDSVEMVLTEMDNSEKKLYGSESVFQSIFSGQQELRKAVEGKEIESTLTYRELLLLESLLYLAKPSLEADFSKPS
jgi:hypothetical protein